MNYVKDEFINRQIAQSVANLEKMLMVSKLLDSDKVSSEIKNYAQGQLKELLKAQEQVNRSIGIS